MKDRGHPPVGHDGEVALHYAMRANRGFEDKGQTLRILSGIESASNQQGSNLARQSLLGILKYPAQLCAVRSSDKKWPPASLRSHPAGKGRGHVMPRPPLPPDGDYAKMKSLAVTVVT